MNDDLGNELVSDLHAWSYLGKDSALANTQLEHRAGLNPTGQGIQRFTMHVPQRGRIEQPKYWRRCSSKYSLDRPHRI